MAHGSLMRTIHYLNLLLLTATVVISACENSAAQPKALTSETSPVTAREEPVQDVAPATQARSLAVKPDQSWLRKEQSPLFDVSADDAFSSDRAGGGLPYRYPVLGGSGSGGGRGPSSEDLSFNMLAHWNEMAIDASGRDHNTPTIAFSIMAVREQMGPGRSARALAITHIAMFEVINAVKGGYQSYIGLPPVTEKTNVDAAIAVAAYDTLVELFPSQEGLFSYQKALDMQTIGESDAKERGIELGHQAAAMILAMRADDGSAHAEPVIGVDYFPSDDPGEWRKDPISNIPLALGANWSTVLPFVLTSADQFRAPPPPALTSPEYTAAFNEVKALGGDGIVTPTVRTEDQEEIGIYWAYDGTPSLCAPPRLYNQIAMHIAKERGTDMVSTARLLALINVAMADAAIAIWESKYHYKFWRPVTGIREADPGTGPSMLGDGNPDTRGDINFSPLGAPATNISNGVDFTPPFPAYPSGHAGFGGAVFQILREFYGTDNIAFTFVSDEFNGETLDNKGNVRPLKPRSFTSLSQAEEENGQSRIYLGIHWGFDKTGGITQGNQIADYLWDHLFKPIQ